MTSPKYSFFRCKTYYLVKSSVRIVQKHVYVPSLSVLAKGINSREIWISRPWENGQKTRVFGARGSKIQRTDVGVGPTRKKKEEIQENTIYDSKHPLFFVQIKHTDHTAKL
jgi:hypothetical protein